MTLRKSSLALLVAAALTPQFAATAYAQAPGYGPAQAPARAYTQAELDQMLAPIALYPDALLSQILMASTYPIEVVEAARWTRANPGVRGDAAVRAVQHQDWDPSVQSLVAFPHILQRMDENLQWTEDLGEAFLANEAAVMDCVQDLRQRAYAAGRLRSTEHIHVVQQGPVIYVRPARPEFVYVPYYDPLYVYGEWRWPSYRPVVWAPWPGYVRPAPGISVGFWFGSPVSLSANFFYGDFDWGRRSVRVVRPTAYYYRPPRVIVNHTTYVNRNVTVDRSRWQHDPHHRRGADYRRAEVRQRFAGAQFERRDEQRATLQQERTADRREERGAERRPDRRDAQQPEQRQAQQPQVRPEQTRPERREAREEQRQRRDTSSTERSQRQAQDQQREQAQAAERSQREAARAQQQQQRQQAQAAERAQRDQQRQQAEASRAQQQQARQQQRQEQRATMPAAQAPQTPRAERQERREERQERREQRQERGQKS